MSGQYRGSQAFNSVNPLVQESVNPNTGSLFLSLPIIKLSGKRSSIDLSVSLFYSAGLRGTFGLPKGWGFDLPYVLHGKSVTVNGRTFAIDKEWTDSEGHSSGLRYNNNHSIKFKSVDPEDLISGRPGQYGYIFSHADGSVDYFDIFGKPLEHHDIYGNYLYYTYVSGETEAVDSPAAKLQSITDSWGQEVIFAHDDGLQTVSLPDNTEVVIKFNNSNAYALKTPSGLTEFEYVEFDDSRAVLQKITYPSGLVSVYEHGAIEYINTKGESGYMPAVESSRSLDFDNKVYRHTKYFYGRETDGATYTGAKLGCQIGGLRDHLMDDDDRAHDYVYDVTTISLDQDEKEVAQTCNWFNNLHQPCRQTQYLLNEEQRFVEVQQTVFDYQIGEKGRAKNSSYYLPSRKGTFRNVSQTSAVEWESARRIDTTYDAYDNVTSTVDYLFDSTNNHIKQSTVETNYATTSKNVRVPIRTRTRDDVLDSLEVREYTLTEDERNIAVSRISFQGPGDTELRPWKEQNFQYDFVGRMTTTRLSWSAGAVIPEHTPSSATTKVEYKEPSNGIVCRIEIGAGGHRTEFQQDIRQKSGPIIAKTLPQGQSERFEYDSIGRLVKQINALEQATHHAYEIGPTGSTKTTTSPKGYIVKTVFDVLDREVQVLDNGDPTNPATREPTRMLSEKSYDALGRLQQSSDRFGLTTTYKSDALNRPVAEIDPFGNELGYKFEHGGAAVTHTINGDLRRIVKLDGKDRPIQTIEYPDSSHKDKISPLVHETLYSGHGKTAKKSTFQQSATEKVLLSSEASVYGPEQTVQSELTKGLGSRGIDTVHRLHVVDLFDNLAFYRKIVNYADGTTFEHAGPLQIFNESNQLACYRNQEGKEEHCQYDENGWLRQKTRFDGSGLRYTYDATGRVTAVEYPSGSSTRNTYDEDGRLVETNEDGKILKYAVTLDGTSTGETYSDGHSTNVILDCYSRPVKSTDVFGVSTESEYNSLGQISRSKCHGDTSVLLYGTVNHTFGQQVGHTCSGSTSTQTTTSYDGFGRPSLDVTQDSAGLVLLETSYKYNSRSQIEYQSSKSALAGELNTERRYQYDGLEQLIAETETFDQFTVAKTYSYDGNSNVVAVDTNGDINLLTYNAIDQRTDGGHRYDANGRMMQDNEGQTFTYDERDRLISVTSASQNASAEFGYLSDNRLAHRISSDGYISKFYHDDNLINAIYTSENDSKTECSKTSLTRNASSGIVAYQNEKYAGQALSQRGSIGLVLEADTHISSQYTAYGTRQTSTTSSNLLTDFGLTQGFTDRLSGLVHLGSRFYNPKQMSFLTMDSVHTENRYAYCEGDPVNRIDPTGHSWVDWLLAPSVGAITTLVGTAVANSLFTAALAAVANVALTAVTGGAWAVAMAVAAGVAGAVGGALGSLASNYISDKWGDRQVSGSDYLWGAIAGAAIGGITAGLTSYGNITAGADRALFTHSAKLGASVGALGGGLREFAAQRIRGEEFTLGSVARIGLAAASGAASGVASGYASRYVYLREQMGRPIAMGVIAKGMWARWTD